MIIEVRPETTELGGQTVRERNGGEPVEFSLTDDGDARRARVNADLGEYLAGEYETVTIHKDERSGAQSAENGDQRPEENADADADADTDADTDTDTDAEGGA